MSTNVDTDKGVALAGINGEKGAAGINNLQHDRDRYPPTGSGATPSGQATKTRGLHRTADDMAAKMAALHGRGRTVTQAGATSAKALPVAKGSNESPDNYDGVTGASSGSGKTRLQQGADEVAAKMDADHGRELHVAGTQPGGIPNDTVREKDAATKNKSHTQRGLRRSAEERAAKNTAKAATPKFSSTHTGTASDNKRNDDRGSLPSKGQWNNSSHPFQPGAQHVRGVDANSNTPSADHNGSRNMAVLRGLGKNRAGRQQIVSGSKQPKAEYNKGKAPRPIPSTATERNYDDTFEDERQEGIVPEPDLEPNEDNHVDTGAPAIDHRSIAIENLTSTAPQQPTFNHQLVEARAVTAESMMHVTQEAQQVDAFELEHDLEQKANKKRKEKQCQRVGGCLILCSCLVLAISLGAGLGIRKENAPTSAPSTAPTSAPTGVLDMLLEDLPEDTLVSINSGTETPQWKAWNWISNHQNITYLQEWRKRQLFALATFYYSFEGEKWPPLIRERWLDYSVEECEWFTNGFGDFDSGGQYSEDIFTKHEDPCDSNGKFVSLWLSDLRLPDGLAPSIPPEIALLTSLFHIDLRGNNINASLSSWLPLPVLHKMTSLASLLITPHGGTLPSELFQLTALTLLNLPNCQLSGTLPTEIGLAAALKELFLNQNQLVAQIPTEVGQMTALTALELSFNQLTGLVPSEVGQMTALSALELSFNQLTGSIPSEIWLLTTPRRLLLNNNDLSGMLATELGLMTHLRTLNLCNNSLTGRIPSELGFLLTKLTLLGLSDNGLSGTIPSELGLLTKLSGFYLHNNHLTGTLPNELRSTNETRLHGNQFTGTVPQHLCSVLVCDCSVGEPLAATCAELSDVPGWPGRFPSTFDGRNLDAILLNVQTYQPDQALRIMGVSGFDKFHRSNFSDPMSFFEKFQNLFVDLSGNSDHSYMYDRGFYLYSHQLPVVSNMSYLLSSFFPMAFLDWMTLTAGNHSVLYSFGRENIGNQAEAYFLHDLIIEVGTNGSIHFNSTIVTGG